MLLIDIIDVFFFEYLRLVDARFNLSWRLIAMQFLHFNTVLFLDSAQLKSCILQFRCQYRLHVLPNYYHLETVWDMDDIGTRRRLADSVFELSMAYFALTALQFYASLGLAIVECMEYKTANLSELHLPVDEGVWSRKHSSVLYVAQNF